MTGLRWEDPPTTTRGAGSTRWAEVTAALKERPGEWALVAEGLTIGISGYLRKQYPGFEFTARNTFKAEGSNTPRCNIYGRYVGAS